MSNQIEVAVGVLPIFENVELEPLRHYEQVSVFEIKPRGDTCTEVVGNQKVDADSSKSEKKKNKGRPRPCRFPPGLVKRPDKSSSSKKSQKVPKRKSPTKAGKKSRLADEIEIKSLPTNDRPADGSGKSDKKEESVKKPKIERKSERIQKEQHNEVPKNDDSNEKKFVIKNGVLEKPKETEEKKMEDSSGNSRKSGKSSKKAKKRAKAKKTEEEKILEDKSLSSKLKEERKERRKHYADISGKGDKSIRDLDLNTSDLEEIANLVQVQQATVNKPTSEQKDTSIETAREMESVPENAPVYPAARYKLLKSERQKKKVRINELKEESSKSGKSGKSSKSRKRLKSMKHGKHGKKMIAEAVQDNKDEAASTVAEPAVEIKAQQLDYQKKKEIGEKEETSKSSSSSKKSGKSPNSLKSAKLLKKTATEKEKEVKDKKLRCLWKAPDMLNTIKSTPKPGSCVESCSCCDGNKSCGKKAKAEPQLTPADVSLSKKVNVGTSTSTLPYPNYFDRHYSHPKPSFPESRHWFLLLVFFCFVLLYRYHLIALEEQLAAYNLPVFPA